MNNKTDQQLELELYFEHGVAKLRYKEPHAKEIFSEEAQDLAETSIKANEKGTPVRTSSTSRQSTSKQ